MKALGVCMYMYRHPIFETPIPPDVGISGETLVWFSIPEILKTII